MVDLEKLNEEQLVSLLGECAQEEAWLVSVAAEVAAELDRVRKFKWQIRNRQLKLQATRKAA